MSLASDDPPLTASEMTAILRELVDGEPRRAPHRADDLDVHRAWVRDAHSAKPVRDALAAEIREAQA